MPAKPTSPTHAAVTAFLERVVFVFTDAHGHCVNTSLSEVYSGKLTAPLQRLKLTNAPRFATVYPEKTLPAIAEKAEKLGLRVVVYKEKTELKPYHIDVKTHKSEQAAMPHTEAPYINLYVFPNNCSAVVQLFSLPEHELTDHMEVLKDAIDRALCGLQDSAITPINSLNQLLFTFRWDSKQPAEDIEETLKAHIAGVFGDAFPCNVNNYSLAPAERNAAADRRLSEYYRVAE